jgi:hypothetical protein
MTTLFEEYQAQKEFNDNSHSMLDKLFYWSTDASGCEIAFTERNVIRVYHIAIDSYTSGVVVLYKYVDNKICGRLSLTCFLQNTKPYIEDSF